MSELEDRFPDTDIEDLDWTAGDDLDAQTPKKPAKIGEYKGGDIFEMPDGSMTYKGPDYSTDDQDEILKMLEGDGPSIPAPAPASPPSAKPISLKSSDGGDPWSTQFDMAEVPKEETEEDAWAEHFDFTSPEPTEETEIDIGDVVIVLPASIKNEDYPDAVASFFDTPEGRGQIDYETGAGARARALVGGTKTPEDKLSTLRQFYPDAIPYNGDNFIFTSPETGRPTVYNPAGLDWGDVHSVTREVAQGVGGALGASFGAAGGFVVGAPTGPGAALTTTEGAILGAGLGTYSGGAAFDFVAQLFYGAEDTRSYAERTGDALLEVGMGAAGQRVGDVASAGAKQLMGGLKPQVQALLGSFQRLDIDPTAAAVTGSKTIGHAEKALETSVISADLLQEQAERVITQTRNAAEALAAKFGTGRTAQGAGETIKNAAKNAADRFGFTQEKAYNAAFDAVGADTLVDIASVKALRIQLQGELAQAPNSMQSTYAPALALLKNIEADAAEKGLTFGAFRQIRTAVGRDLDSPILTGSTGAQNAAMKRIYGALTEDLAAIAREAGPEAAKKLAVADRFTRMWVNNTAKTMQKIVDFDTDERAFRFAMQASQDGGSGLARLRRSFNPDEWDTVAATVLKNLGRANPGAQDATGEAFSVNSFVTNWSKLAPEAKEALFGGKRYAGLQQGLDDLVRVAASLKDVERLANHSNTAGAGGNKLQFMALGGALFAGVAGDVTTTATVAGGFLSNRIAAKLITSPKFVKWLTTPVEEGGIKAHMGRLTAIAADAPEMAEEIELYIAALAGQNQPNQ